jgi:hypothetical protein
MSIASRLVDKKRAHEIDLLEHRKKLEKMHEDLASRREDWLDVQTYRANEKELRRKSVCYRLESWREQKIQIEKEKSRQKILAEEEAFFKQMDHEDIQQFKRQQVLEKSKDLQLGNFKI